jgi:prepilin-type N-terminal cleavage/methylation domain-containing protein
MDPNNMTSSILTMSTTKKYTPEHLRHCTMDKCIHNQKGFTLIEVVAVLVILGVIAATALPKYLDMGREAIMKVASTAIFELNTREKMKLMEWKLNDGNGFYPSPGGTGVTCGPTNPTV